MKNDRTIDYRSFIVDWRCRWIEVPKDIRKGKVWKPLEITVPDPWSETASYTIKMAKHQFFMVVKDGDEQYRYLLGKELMSLLDKYTVDASDNKYLIEEIRFLKTELEKANLTIKVLKKELLKAQMELEIERRKKL